MNLPFILPFSKPLPRSLIGFITHTSMLLISLGLSFFFTKGNIERHGYTRGSFRLTGSLFLWVLPMSFFSILSFIVAMKEGTIPDTTIGIYIENILKFKQCQQ